MHAHPARPVRVLDAGVALQVGDLDRVAGRLVAWSMVWKRAVEDLAPSSPPAAQRYGDEHGHRQEQDALFIWHSS